jgi:hypothetical protein
VALRERCGDFFHELALERRSDRENPDSRNWLVEPDSLEHRPLPEISRDSPFQIFDQLLKAQVNIRIDIDRRGDLERLEYSQLVATT